MHYRENHVTREEPIGLPYRRPSRSFYGLVGMLAYAALVLLFFGTIGRVVLGVFLVLLAAWIARYLLEARRINKRIADQLNGGEVYVPTSPPLRFRKIRYMFEDDSDYEVDR